MITFFTHIRPFDEIFTPLQRTAIASWKHAYGDCKVVLFYSDDSLELDAQKLDCDYVVCKQTEEGLSDFGYMFEYVELNYDTPWYCEVSSDIVLSSFQTLMRSLMGYDKPLVIGPRLDFDVTTGERTVHPPSAVDWFLYRKDTLPYKDIPPFNIGRSAYDNWMVWAGLELWDMQVVNAGYHVQALHYNHPHPEHGDKTTMLKSFERRKNLELTRVYDNMYWAGIDHAQEELI